MYNAFPKILFNCGDLGGVKSEGGGIFQILVDELIEAASFSNADANDFTDFGDTSDDDLPF